MTTIANIDLSNATVQANGYYTSDAIALTTEAFLGIQVVKVTPKISAPIKIVPLVSNDGTNYSVIRDDRNGFVAWEISPDDNIQKAVSNVSNLFQLEPVRATNAKIMIIVGDCVSGKVSIYAKTSMTES